MQKIVVVIVLITGFIACSKNTKEEQQQVPPSIQKIITDNSRCMCLPYIKEFSWRGEVVYLLGFRGPACSWFPSYYDASGATITMAAGYTLNDFLSETQFIKTVWQCDDETLKNKSL